MAQQTTEEPLKRVEKPAALACAGLALLVLGRTVSALLVAGRQRYPGSVKVSLNRDGGPTFDGPFILKHLADLDKTRLAALPRPAAAATSATSTRD